MTPFDIVGFIASVIALAGVLRNLITKIFGKKERFIRFADYLTEVERVLTLYMRQAWRESVEIRSIVERVRQELTRARDLVSPLLDRKGKKGFLKITNADRYAKPLEESQAAIVRYIGLLGPAALAHAATARTAQDGQEHNGNEDLDHALALLLHEEQLREANGNEDLDYALALLLHEEQLREANPRDERSQASRDEEDETVTALQALLDEDEEEEIAMGIAIRLSLTDF